MPRTKIRSTLSDGDTIKVTITLTATSKPEYDSVKLSVTLAYAELPNS